MLWPTVTRVSVLAGIADKRKVWKWFCGSVIIPHGICTQEAAGTLWLTGRKAWLSSIMQFILVIVASWSETWTRALCDRSSLKSCEHTVQLSQLEHSLPLLLEEVLEDWQGGYIPGVTTFILSFILNESINVRFKKFATLHGNGLMHCVWLLVLVK